MAIWMELVAAVMLVGAGVCVGKFIGRGQWWWVGFAISLAAVVLVMLGRRSVRLSFVAPISWATWPHVAPLLMAVAIPIMLQVLVMRLPEKRKRIMVRVLMGAMVAYFVLLPLVLPLAARWTLLSQQTKIDVNGICLQQHRFSCGPAAAVTCLKKLGVRGEEGKVAVASLCAPGLGTNEWLLVEAVNGLYGQQGIRCDYRYVEEVSDIHTPAVVAVRSRRFGGHYLAVLKVQKDGVVVGDPLSGIHRLSRADFQVEWNGAAIEINSKNGNLDQF